MSNTANMKAFAAVAGMGDASDKVPALPMAIGNRRPSKSGGLRPELFGLHVNGLPSPPASMPATKFPGMSMDRPQDPADIAVEDQENMFLDDESSQNDRVRRSSDGQSLLKEGRKFNRPEIYCEKCGKGYKHSSCLSKHMFVPLLPPHPTQLSHDFPLGRSRVDNPWFHPLPPNITRQIVC